MFVFLIRFGEERVAGDARCAIVFAMLANKGALLDVVEASREAVTLGELARAALDGLRSGFGCTLGSFTHCPEDGIIDILSCTDADVLGEYRRDWFADDPINDAVRRHGGSWLVPASRLPEWDAMRRHPLYAEWAPSKDVRYLLHVRLSEAPYLQAGACNIFLCRPKREGDFGHRELLALSQMMPDLETAVRRCARIAAMNSHGALLESLLDGSDSRARLALRANGQIVWMSDAAKRMLAGQSGGRPLLPALLAEEARRLASGAGGSIDVRFSSAGGARMTAALRRTCAGTGEPFVVIDLRSLTGDLPEAFRARFGLTSAEAGVLSDLAEGFGNAQIAARRSVSITTIRTHVAHILSKMGVRSRLQAGVLARAAINH